MIHTLSLKGLVKSWDKTGERWFQIRAVKGLCPEARPLKLGLQSLQAPQREVILSWLHGAGPRMANCPYQLLWDGGKARGKSPVVGLKRVLCSCPGAGEGRVQIRGFIYIISREFLRSIPWSGCPESTGLAPLALGWASQNPLH